MKFDWVVISRDALIVLLLGTVGLFAGSLLSGTSRAGVGIGALLGLSAGFCLSGCLARRERLKHLAGVAVAAWLVGSGLNLVLGRTSLSGIFTWGLLICATAALLGGGLSFAIARPEAGASSPQP